MVATISVIPDFGPMDRMIAAIVQQTPVVLAKAVLRGAQLATGAIRAELYEVTDGRGGLARSFRERFIPDPNGLIAAESYSDLVYAGIQNDGGVIRAGARKLAVPIKSAHVPTGKWPRHFPDSGAQALHLIPGRRGKASILAQISGRNNERVKPIFVLLNQVRIKPHHYIEAAEAKIAPVVQELLREAYSAMVDAA